MWYVDCWHRIPWQMKSARAAIKMSLSRFGCVKCTDQRNLRNDKARDWKTTKRILDAAVLKSTELCCECHLWAWSRFVETFHCEFSNRIIAKMVKRPKLSFGSTRNQYFAAISGSWNITNSRLCAPWCNTFIFFHFLRAANLLMLSFGCTIGWVSPALPLLQSPDTPLSSGPMTTEQISWTGSTLSVGALVGNILYGYLMVRYGSKMVLMSLAVPQLVISLRDTTRWRGLLAICL